MVTMRTARVCASAPRPRAWPHAHVRVHDHPMLVWQGMVFAMLFGEAQFEHLVGDLAVVSAERIKAEGLGREETAARLQEIQMMREARLAKLLSQVHVHVHVHISVHAIGVVLLSHAHAHVHIRFHVHVRVHVHVHHLCLVLLSRSG